MVGGLSRPPVTSDVRDGVVHGVLKQQWGQPRQGDSDSDWQLFFLHPHPQPVHPTGAVFSPHF